MNEDGEYRPSKPLLGLVNLATDGELSPAEWDELHDLLAADEQALDWYCTWMLNHACLYQDLALGAPILPGSASQGMSASCVFPPRRRSRKQWRQQVALFATLAASLLILVLTWIWHGRQQPMVDPPLPAFAVAPPSGFTATEAARRSFHEPDRGTVAVMSRIADASSSLSPLTPGAAVRRGRFVLDKGVVQLEFLSGANVVVEGPADLNLLSESQIHCHRGQVRARVPALARGFTIDTPTHRAVDLGTEFAVSVRADGATEVHVFDGEVRLLSKLSPELQELHLFQGNGFLADADGSGVKIAAENNRFISAEQLSLLSDQDSRARYLQWQKFSEKMSADDDVLVYFNFEDYSPWDRVLRQSRPSHDASLDGALVGCRWTQGRWPAKQALEFKGTEDRVRLNIPGEYASVSLACWLRVDGFDRWLSGLLLTDGHDVGEVHWQFTETGQLLLGVKADSDRSQEYLSDVVLRPRDVGRWIHLACVYNQADEEVVHYLDGRRVEAMPIHKHVKLRFGAAEIGNWAPEDFIDHRIRSLNGRMDEFLLFKKVLSDADVFEIYEAGRPNS